MTTRAERLNAIWESPPSLYSWFATVDHKVIGMRYLVVAFVFLALGGADAALMRAQLARPENHFLSPETYNQLFTMHGTTMIFWYASPILSGFGNFLVPLMIGSRDMAFPRLNAFGFWAFVLSGALHYIGITQGIAPHTGWFAYTPLSEGAYSPGLNTEFYALALLFLTISTSAGAINFIATIFTMRAPGMSLNRMPLMMWSTLTTSASMLMSLPALSAALIFLELDRRYGFHFYDAARGGTPMLWQHLFWLFGHPWVYILILPATGMVSMMLPTFCRRRMVGYAFVAMATVSTGLIGFGVWAHHMFATGLPHVAEGFFSAASMAVSIPSAVQIFAWIATMWASRRIVRPTPMLFILGFFVLFVIGGISGVMVASVPFDWQAHDTYFVVAHLHYVLIGMNLFPVIAAFYYWLPKMTGRMLDERLGRWNFWIMFVGMNITFFPMHILGMRGMPRRVYTYAEGLGWDNLNMVETVGAYVFAFGVLLFVINVVRSRYAGAPAGDNPWNASTLEWSISSPPPAYNFEVIPVVASRDPLWDAPVADTPGDARILDERKETLGTSTLDALPNRRLPMPEDSLVPLLLALAVGLVFVGLLYKSMLFGVGGAVATLICIVLWIWPGSEFPEASA
ncbi:MAG: cytochrome c oxidase subunit I [Gemmatimonadota bacterium]|nr:cytochrome c oxidase subunit I [Gemmatimonadota bacterium]